MKYTIEFELPDNKTIENELPWAYVSWAIWGYAGIAKAKPVEESKKSKFGKDINVPCNDTISKQAALDVVNDCGICIQKILDLPSAEPEIIHCGECAYAEVADPDDGQDGYVCQFHPGSIWFSGSFCSWAKAKNEKDE